MCYVGFILLKEDKKMTFSNIDQGLLLFYIAVGIMGIFLTLLYIASKK